jgi:RimJ/RimL family protein N-acetyltransferase
LCEHCHTKRPLTYRKLVRMERIRLDSGREVIFRSIRADDGPRLQEAYRRLSPEAQYQRFFISKPRLTDADTRYLVEVDGQDHVALVAFDAADTEQIIGVGRFVRGEDRRIAEVAIVVGDPVQREGLGSELVERLAAAARERGIERLTANVLAMNGPAHRLLIRLSNSPARVRHMGEVDELDLDITLPAADASEPGRAAMIGGWRGS